VPVTTRQRDPLTQPQRVALKTIIRFVDRHGYSPSVREVADLLDVSVNAAHKMLGRLRNGGWVDWEDGQRRTLRVLAAP
jgi:Mn-dependent DtxR family transcriptional regulator